MTESTQDSDEWMDDKPKQVLEADQSVSIKAYYKGYSLLVTKRDGATKILPLIEDAMKAIDWMRAQSGFEPSWNIETNKTTLTAQKQELGVCGKCGSPNGLSKAGKIYCLKKCWLLA